LHETKRIPKNRQHTGAGRGAVHYLSAADRHGVGRAMNWVKVSDHCIRSGEWKIYRYPLATPERFELWRGDRFIDGFDTSNEAKQAAIAQGRKAA